MSKDWEISRRAKEQARKGLFADAITTASPIKDEGWQGIALREIAEEQAKRGLFQDAITTASLIKDEHWQGIALRKIAKEQAKRGLFQDAFTTASLIKGWRKRDALVVIVREQAEKGLFADAFTTVSLIEDEDTETKLGALSDIANIAKKQSRRDIVHDARIVAEEIGKDYIQTNLQKFSEALYPFLDDLEQAEANLYHHHTYHDLEKTTWNLLDIEGLLKEEIADLARECLYIIHIMEREKGNSFCIYMLRDIAERLRDIAERRGYSSLQPLEPALGQYLKFGNVEPAPAQYPEIEALAVARLKNAPENKQFLVGETFHLQAGILKERPEEPGFQTTPVNLPRQDEILIDITVYCEDVTIEPNWMQKFMFYQNKESTLVEFQLTPQTVGQKEIRVEFYYERHWLAKITFDIEVAEAEIGVVSTSSSSLETTKIRPPVHQNYPVDMHIRIYPQGSRYGAEISVPGQVQRIPIAMSSHDLALLNQHLQERILAIASGKLVRHQPGLLERAKTFFRKPVQPATFCSTNPEAKLRLLAETGYYAFKKVFSNPNVRVFVNDHPLKRVAWNYPPPQFLSGDRLWFHQAFLWGWLTNTPFHCGLAAAEAFGASGFERQHSHYGPSIHN